MDIINCSKAELIYIIKNYKCDPERVETLLLAYRSKELIAQADTAFDSAIKAMEEYNHLLKPYGGCTWQEISTAIIGKAAELSGAYEKHMRKYNQLQKKLNAVMKGG